MKVTSFTGTKQVDNIKIFKPVSKIFVKTNYPDVRSGSLYGIPTSQRKTHDYYDNNATIRVRLVDGRSGRSDEIVPEMPLDLLSEICSKFEGFQRRAYKEPYYIADGKYGYGHICGYDLHSVILGGIVGNGIGEDCAAIDLSNDKYLDVDLRNLNKVLSLIFIKKLYSIFYYYTNILFFFEKIVIFVLGLLIKN